MINGVGYITNNHRNVQTGLWQQMHRNSAAQFFDPCGADGTLSSRICGTGRCSIKILFNTYLTRGMWGHANICGSFMWDSTVAVEHVEPDGCPLQAMSNKQNSLSLWNDTSCNDVQSFFGGVCTTSSSMLDMCPDTCIGQNKRLASVSLVELDFH